MSKFLFKVADVFQLKKGLVIQADKLYDELDKAYGTGGRLQLRRPDGTSLETDSWIEVFHPTNLGRPVCLSVQKTLTKVDVPIGTEVWLVELVANQEVEADRVRSK